MAPLGSKRPRHRPQHLSTYDEDANDSDDE
jgi:hypothetical protein